MDQKQVCASVMRCLNKLRLSEAFCDITLLVGDVTIPAHKVVLAGTSKFFHTVLGSDSATDMFQINGISAPNMVSILDFLYTGQILINKSNVVSIDNMAQQLQIDILTEVCSAFRMSEEKKKGTSKTQDPPTRGSCRTRTYTRWGKRQAIQLAESSGPEGSDLEELDYDTEDDEDRSVEGSVNMSLGAVISPSYDCVQRENIISESIRRSDISPKPKPAATNANARKRRKTRITRKNPVMSKILKRNQARNDDGCTALTPLITLSNTCPPGKITEQEPEFVADNTDSVINITEHIQEDAQQFPSSTEFIINTNEAGPSLEAGSASIESMMTEMCNVVDLASISVYQEHDLTVTSITDAPSASHVLIADPSTDGTDLTSFIDIQSLLASYSSGQSVILRTCTQEEATAQEAMQSSQEAMNEEDIACSQATTSQEVTSQEAIACSEQEAMAENVITAGLVCTQNEAITEESLTESAMTEALIGSSKEAITEEVMVYAPKETIPLEAIAYTQEEATTGEAIVFTQKEVLAEGAIAYVQGETMVNEAIVLNPKDGITEEPVSYTQDEAIVFTPSEAITVDAVTLEGTISESKGVEQQIESNPVLEENIGDSSAKPTQSDLSQNDSIAMSSKCDVEQVHIMDNLQSFDISGISSTGDEAGFHDYCLNSDSVKLLNNSSESDTESHLNDDLTVPTDNERGGSASNVKEPINTFPNESDLPESNTSTFHISIESGASPIPIATVTHEINSEEHDGGLNNANLEISQECCNEANQEYAEPSEDAGEEEDQGYWNDTHIMIIKQPSPEPVDPSQEQELPPCCEKKRARVPTCCEKKRARVQCTWCPATYHRPDLVRAHAKEAHPEHMFPCRFCSRRFLEEDRCEDHMDWCRVGEKVAGRYRCPQCIYSAAKAIFVVKHYRTKHTTKNQRTCDSCCQVFKTLDDFCDHQLQIHDLDTEKLEKKKVHVCHECNFKTVKLYLFKSHESLHSEVSYPCEKCSKRFKTLVILKRHEKTIHNDCITKCSKCDFTSKYVATVKAHEYRAHNVTSDKQTVHHCHYCNYSNVDRANLRKHERFKHSDERPFLCSSCPKAFKQKTQLTVHERVHTGARPFCCPLCPYAGRSKVALLNHNSHRHSDAKPCVCDFCGFQCKCASNLWLHKERCKKKNNADADKIESAESTLKPTSSEGLSTVSEES